MATSFAVHPTSHYQRLSTKLQKGHRDFEAVERSAVAVLAVDPYNRSRNHNIKKLEGVPAAVPSAAGACAMTFSVRWFFSATAVFVGRIHIRDYANRNQRRHASIVL
jgi:hypothetical protein